MSSRALPLLSSSPFRLARRWRGLLPSVMARAMSGALAASVLLAGVLASGTARAQAINLGQIVQAELRPGWRTDAGTFADLLAPGLDAAALLARVDAVWTLTSGLGFEALLRRHAPRLCIAEPVMADAMRALGLGSCPPTRVLMLSARRHVGTDGMPGLSCACGHLSDAAEAPAIMAMLQRALACAHRSARDCGDTPCALKGSLAPVAPGLSERETEVLERLGRGQPPRTIARRMGISVKTVESYRSQIKQKLGFQDSRALLEFAVLWRRGADAGTRS